MKILNIHVNKVFTSCYVPKIIMSKSGGLHDIKKEYDNNSLKISNSCSKKSVIVIPKFVKLNPEDFIAIGLYFAEGEKYINSPGKTKHSGQVSIVNNNIKGLTYFCNLLQKFGVKIEKLHYRIGLNINFKDRVNINELLAFWISSLQLSPEQLRLKLSDLAYEGPNRTLGHQLFWRL